MSENPEESSLAKAAERHKRFGEFLVERGLIKPEQRDEALTIQDAIYQRLGTLAAVEDMISVTELYDVLEEQKYTGAMFGETAKRMKLLDDSQLGELLNIQDKVRMKLGEILVGLFYLQRNTMEAALENFWKEEGEPD
ncbi:hypothetical protein LLH00_03055 [bacterium]|nr:hypothetical protein [bacterium]